MINLNKTEDVYVLTMDDNENRCDSRRVRTQPRIVILDPMVAGSRASATACQIFMFVFPTN